MRICKMKNLGIKQNLKSYSKKIFYLILLNQMVQLLKPQELKIPCILLHTLFQKGMMMIHNQQRKNLDLSIKLLGKKEDPSKTNHLMKVTDHYKKVFLPIMTLRMSKTLILIASLKEVILLDKLVKSFKDSQVTLLRKIFI